MFCAGILAILWTCILNIGIGVEHGVGTLDGYVSVLFTMNSISTLLNFGVILRTIDSYG